MNEEPDFAREYSEQSEEHARRLLKATRHALNESRKQIAVAEKRIARNLAELNEAKRVIYERGWSEDNG